MYPSGSMTLPMKSSQQKGSKKATKSSPEPASNHTTALKKAMSSELLAPAASVVASLNPNSKAIESDSSSVEIASVNKKTESGESDPGYESDSTGSKRSKSNVTCEGPKATTLPRRSAAVQKMSLDRRKLAEDASTANNTKPSSTAAKEATSANGFTVEIISPVRVKPQNCF